MTGLCWQKVAAWYACIEIVENYLVNPSKPPLRTIFTLPGFQQRVILAILDRHDQIVLLMFLVYLW